MLLSVPAGSDAAAAAATGTGGAGRGGGTEEGREVDGVEDPDGGGGMSVLSTRVAFFLGCGAVPSAVSLLVQVWQGERAMRVTKRVDHTYRSGFPTCRIDVAA